MKDTAGPDSITSATVSRRGYGPPPPGVDPALWASYGPMHPGGALRAQRRRAEIERAERAARARRVLAECRAAYAAVLAARAAGAA